MTAVMGWMSLAACRDYSPAVADVHDLDGLAASIAARRARAAETPRSLTVPPETQ